MDEAEIVIEQQDLRVTEPDTASWNLSVMSPKSKRRRCDSDDLSPPSKRQETIEGAPRYIGHSLYMEDETRAERYYQDGVWSSLDAPHERLRSNPEAGSLNSFIALQQPKSSWEWMIGRQFLDAPIQARKDASTHECPSALYIDRGAVYSRYTSTKLPNDDLSSVPSQKYVELTHEVPSTYQAGSLFASSKRSHEGNIPPRQLVVLDLNGSLLYRDKHKARDGTSFQIYRRPYLGCLAQYLAHEQTRNAVLIEQKSKKKKYHILPSNIEVTSNQISFKRKGKHRHNPDHPDAISIGTFSTLSKKVRKHPGQYTLMAPLDAMIWSSVQPQNLLGMVDAALGVEQSLLRACWTRRMLGLGSNGYFSKVQTTKNLERIWWSSDGEYGPNTTVLIDDTELKARLQPWNLLQVSEYAKADVKTKTSIRRANKLRKAAFREGEGGNENGAGDNSVLEHNEPMEEKGNEEHAFDQTILAVIGILETMRTQTNVPAWIRSGGLWKNLVPDRGVKSSIQGMMSADMDRARTAGDEDDDSGLNIGGNDVGVVVAENDASSLWCSRPTLLAYWAEKGTRVLKGRNIPVSPGIIYADSDPSVKALRAPRRASDDE